MSLFSVWLGALATLALLHAWFMPALRKRLESDRSPSVIGPLAWYRVCAVLRAGVLALFLGTSLFGAAVWFLTWGDTGTVDEVSRMLRRLRALQDFAGQVDLGFTVSTFALLAGGLLWLTYKQSKQHADSLFAEIELAERERVVEAYEADQWDELPPTEQMRQLGAIFEERQRSWQRAQDSGYTAHAKLVEEELDELRMQYFRADAARRLVLEVPQPFADDLVLPPGAGWWERVRHLVFNRGVLKAMSGGSRLLAFAGLALLVPAAATLSLGVGKESIENHVVRLEEVRVELGRKEAEASLQQALKSPTVAAPAPRPRGDDEAEEVLAETYDRDFNSALVSRAVPAVVGARVAQAIVREQILQQFARTNPAVGATAGADELHVGRDLEVPRQRLRERIHAIRRENAEAWNAIKRSLPDGSDFATATTRTDLARAMGGEVMRSAFGAAAGDLGSAYDAHANHYLAALARGDDLDKARAASFDSNAGRYWTTGTEANLRSMKQHVDTDGHVLDRALRDHPPTLYTSPHSAAEVGEAQRILADMPDSHRSAQALFGFSDLAPGRPGDELRTPAGRTAAKFDPDRGLARGPDSTYSKTSNTAFQRSRSYASLRGYSRVGGVLIGRPPESDKSRADVVDISWEQRDAGRMDLILKTREGAQHRFGPYPRSLVLQGLTYAADQRPLAVTMITADPVPDLKIVTHPALIDSPAGCNAVAIDRLADEASSGADYRSRAESAVRGALAAYQLAWSAAMLRTSMSLSDYGDGDRQTLQSTAERMRQRALQQLKPPVYDLVRMALRTEASLPLRVKPQYYDAKLVDTLSACAQTQASVDGFSKCLGASAQGHRVETLLARLPEFQIWSGVRELPYSIDPKLDFLRPSAGVSHDLWPFDFVLQTAFTRQGLVSEDEEVDQHPWEFPLVHDRLVADVTQLVRRDRKRLSVVAVMREFTVIQRLFRAALAGQLGDGFPLQKLAALSRELTAQPVAKSAYKTPRWNRRNLEQLYALQFAQLSEHASPTLRALIRRGVQAIDRCAKADGRNPASCRFESLKREVGQFEATGGNASLDAGLARELHAALGVLELRRVLGVHAAENTATDGCPSP